MKKEFLAHLRDNPIIKYALKHLQESNLQMHGHVYTDHYRGGKLLAHNDQGKNTFTTAGMAYLLNVIFFTTGKTAEADFYVGIFHNNVTPGLTDTAAKLGASGDYGESQDTDYSTPATNKPSYVVVSTSTASCTNAAAPASFTIAAASQTIYGAFLSTAMAKTATSGTLMCAKKFSSPRAVITADVLAVSYVITCTTS